jgi:amidase
LLPGGSGNSFARNRRKIMDRREFVTSTAVAGALGAAPPPGPEGLRQERFPLLEQGIAELSAALGAGRTTSRRLVEQYSARIRALDERGPRLGHVLEINPDAPAIAAQLDAERRSGRVRGPLHGIPVLIKDNIATADRMETTAGSLALLGGRPPRDAFIVERLRQAGAVILGKTNLSEWANFRSTRSTSGWSARGGQCRNPYALDRNPSGSSSGSAVAAAVSSCAAAIGTETNGSIISPSSICGVVGVKPTVGLVSRSGIVPIAHSQDTAGPMTRTVMDAALLLTALAGTDPADEATAVADGRRADYARALEPGALRGARLGVLRPMFSPKANVLYEAALVVLRERGAVPVEVQLQVNTQGQGDLLSFEFKADLERYFAEWAPTSGLRTMADLVEFNRREAAREMPWFGQEIVETAANRGPLTSPEYLQIRERLQRATREEGIDRVMDEQRLDALIAPSAAPARPIDLVGGDAGGGGSSGLAAIAGYPHVTVPMGYVHGLPVGLSFFGRAWSEELLLRLAFDYEQTSRMRRAPLFDATARVPWNGRA